MAASGRAATARQGGIYSRRLTREEGEKKGKTHQQETGRRVYSRRALSDLSSGHGGTESLCGELLWIGQPGCSVRSAGIGHLEIESKEYQFSSGIGSQQAAQVGADFSLCITVFN